MRTEHFLLPGLLLLAAAACDRGDAEAPVAADPPAAEAAAAASAPEVTCAPQTARELIEGLVLEDPESGCRILLPLDPAAGRYEVAVSGAGLSDVAAVEAQHEGERLVATRGFVVLESVEGGLLQGRVEAEDHLPPGTGRIEGSFEVSLP